MGRGTISITEKRDSSGRVIRKGQTFTTQKAYRDYLKSKGTTKTYDDGMTVTIKQPDRDEYGRTKTDRQIERNKAIAQAKTQISTVSQGQNVYTGRVEGGTFTGVRTVSQREQALRTSEQAGFVSIDPRVTTSKQRADKIAENLALRTGLGMGSLATIKAPLSAELTFKKTTTPPRELTGGEKALRFLTTPVDVSKVPILGAVDTRIKQNMAFEREMTEKLKTGTPYERFFYKPYKVKDDAGDLFYKGSKTPATYILSYGFNVAGQGLKMVAPKISAVFTKSAFFSKFTFSGIKMNAAKVGTIAIGTAYVGYQSMEIGTGRKTLGGVIGETGAFLLSSKITKPLAIATVKAPSVVYGKMQTGIQHIKAEYKFSKFGKSIHNKYEYRVFENTGNVQRDLFGKSAPTTHFYNPNKIGFGIEKNPLLPAKNTFMPTGQTKLATGKIVAYDLGGNLHKVKIVDHTPFVFNERVGKFTEFVSGGQYKLFTLTPNIKNPVLSISGFDISQQKGLTEFGFSSISKTVKPPTKIQIGGSSVAASSSPSPTFFTGTASGSSIVGVKQIFTPYAQTQYVTSATTFIAPPITSTTSINLGAREDSLKALFPAVSFKTNIKSTDKLDIGFKQDFKLNTTSLTGTKPVSTSAIDIASTSAIDVASISATQSKSASDTQLITGSASGFASASGTITNLSYGTGFNFSSLAPPIPITLPTFFKFSTGKGGGIGKGKIINISQPKSFNPSVRASAFKLTGKTSKGSILSGIGERYIPKKRRKK